MSISSRSILAALSISSVCLLAGCGGGGADGSAAVTPPPPVNPTHFGCPALPASTAAPGTLDAIVDAAAAKEMQAKGLPSMIVTIAKNDTVLLSRAYGYSNIASCAPAQTTTEYQIGSLTKQFTAVAILRLHEEGKLDIDQHVANYLPAYAFDSRLTLRMLLQHTSGLDDYVNNPTQFPPPPGWENGLTQNYILTQIAAAPLLFAPGTAFEYSNSGYFILGSIIEAVSGMTYFEYLQASVLQPGGLTDTYYAQPISAATGYSYSSLAAQSARTYTAGLIPHPSIYFSSGALWSSAEELNRFDAALRNGKVISASSYTLLTTPPAVPVHGANVASDYAMGWVRASLAGRAFAWHNGQTLAFTSFNGMLMDSGLSLAVLTNSNVQENSPLLKFGQELLQEICAAASTVGHC